MDKSNEESACNGEQQEDPVDNMDEESAAKEKLTSDPNKVKFTSVNLDGYDGKNGEAKVDIYVAQTTVGMGKEELMKYANEPFWVRLRMFLFVFFWVAWLGMLVGAVVIILLAPRCPPAPRLEWYQKTAMYDLDVETFQDSDGDGYGDFKGLLSKLDYFKTQNIGTLLLSAFYESDSDGITDHKKIDDKLGTLADFKELLEQLNKKDIKLVIDFNPNHSSDKHQWFIDSVAKKEPHKDFYVWADSKNEWLNVHGKSAWTWNEERNQYYLGTFGENKPDLNLRNEKVREELKDILRFWLGKGVHGFKVIAASHLIEDENMRDEPLGTKTVPDGDPKYEDYDHIYTVDNSENAGLFAEWRDILSNFTETIGLRKILLAEVYKPLISYYKNDSQPFADLYFNNEFTQISDTSTAIEVKQSIDLASRLPENAWPTFLVGSGKVKRLANRVGDDLVDAIHMISFIAKGTPITYFGDELGMEDLTDVKGIQMFKSVMPWSNDTNAGFSTGAITLKIIPDYESINVQTQEKETQSHLNIFKTLLGFRGQPALNFGLQEYPVLTNETFSMIRVRKGSPGYLVVANFGTNSTVVDFTAKSDYLPDIGRIEVRSKNLISGPLADGGHPKISLSNIPLEPKQAVVLSFVPQFKG